MITRTRKIQMLKKAIKYGKRLEERRINTFYICNAIRTPDNLNFSDKDESALRDLKPDELLPMFEIRKPKVVLSNDAWFIGSEFKKRYKLLRKAIIILYIKRFLLGE